MKSRFLLLAAFLPVFAAPALAEPRDDVMAGAVRCAGIADDRTWLDCFYGSAQPMRAKLGLAPAPGAQQALVPPSRPGAPLPSVQPGAGAPAMVARPMPPAREDDGIFHRLLTHTVVKAEAPSRMTAYKFDSGGFFTVTLANGETWRQSVGDEGRAKWHNPAQSYVVTILPGDKLRISSHEIYRVERLR